MASALIRRARQSDAAAVAEVQRVSWQETYDRALPAEVLQSLPFTTQMWQERLRAVAAPRSRMAAWVAEVDDEIAGFATVGPNDEDSSLGHLYAIYVRQAAQSTGIGRRLHQASLRSLAEEGFSEAVLWVLESNAAARRFYELADWKADAGRRIEEVESVPLRLVRYRISLAPSAVTAR